MKIDSDDPKITAYALNELEPQERQEVEALLQTDESAREAVEEIRRTAKLLTEELQKEGCPELSRENRSAIETRLNQSNKKIIPFPWFYATSGLAVAAACVMIFVDLSGVRQDPNKKQIKSTPTQLIVGKKADTTITFYSEASSQTAMLVNAETKDGKAQTEADSSVAIMTPPSATSAGIFFSGGMAGYTKRDTSALSGAWYSQEYKGGETTSKNEGFNTEGYDRIQDNPFLNVAQNPLSTFSIDVDTASYANIRRFLTQNTMPPKDAVRIEEMVNYFSYDYAPPENADPFAVHVEVSSCPWNEAHRLARIGIKGKEIAPAKRPSSNLVFLIDVSGSMNEPNKLPLVKRSLQMLTRELTENDRVAIVVYAGSSGLVLPSTSCDRKEKVLEAIENLEAGGSTNGGEGIRLAYDTATAGFIKEGINRVILATDGDFNVGVTNQGDLTRLIEEKAKSGVFLSVLGFGMGNLKDSTMEKLADKGNGNYAYIDTPNEGRKVLVEQMSGTLITIAKDVKIQVEFNPAKVSTYRLIGYENRMLAKEDFNDDKKDAGEIGAGHTVTALYEIVPAGKESEETPSVDSLKYQKPVQSVKEKSQSDELLTLKLRYKKPDGDKSSLMEFPIKDKGGKFAKASRDFKFAAAVASFGMLLRDSEHKGNSSYNAVLEFAQEGKGTDEKGYRAEFIELVKKTKEIQKK